VCTLHCFPTSLEAQIVYNAGYAHATTDHLATNDMYYTMAQTIYVIDIVEIDVKFEFA